jgi:hypothetical protein
MLRLFRYDEQIPVEELRHFKDQRRSTQSPKAGEQTRHRGCGNDKHHSQRRKVAFHCERKGPRRVAGQPANDDKDSSERQDQTGAPKAPQKRDATP